MPPWELNLATLCAPSALQQKRSGWMADNSTSYGSLAYQLREVGQEASSCGEFVSQTLGIIASTTVVTGLLGLMFVMTALMSYFGIAYLNKCPVEKRIPLYMIVGGGVGMVKVVTLFFKHRRIRREDLEEYAEDQGSVGGGFRATEDDSYTSRSTQVVEFLVSVFLLGWFVAGNLWVWKVYKPPAHQSDRSPTPNFYCNDHLYNFALAQLGICHGLIVLGVLVVVTMLCCARCLGGPQSEWV